MNFIKNHQMATTFIVLAVIALLAVLARHSFAIADSVGSNAGMAANPNYNSGANTHGPVNNGLDNANTIENYRSGSATYLDDASNSAAITHGGQSGNSSIDGSNSDKSN